MIRRTVALLTLLTLILPAASVWPLGVGNIELRSALNEPLVARIPLRSIEVGDLDSMRVALGSADQFQRAGVERPFFLTQLSFEVVPTSAGGYIRVSSEQPVAEPFLNFLLEVNWPRGRVIREYTVLLDPPVYGAAIQSSARQSVPTVDAEPSLAAPAPEPAPSAAPAPAPSTSASVNQTVAPAPQAVVPGSSYGPVTETDTLWSLAQRFRPDPDYTVQQTMLAILRANPDAFSAGNVNTLRAGAVLDIPSAAEVAAIARAQALEEVSRQHAEWQQMRAALAAAPPPAAPEGDIGAATDGDAATDGGTSSETPAIEGLTEPEPAAETTASTATTEEDARLELLGSGSDAEGTVGAPEQATTVEDLRDELNLALEEIGATRRENADLASRLTDAEALIDDLSRLVELKDENIAALQQRLAEAEMPVAEAGAPAQDTGSMEPSPPATETGQADTVQVVPPVEPPEPVAMSPEPPAEEPATSTTAVAPGSEPATEQPSKPKVPLPPPPEPVPTSYMDILREVLPVDPIILAGGLGGLLLIGVLLALMRRRRSQSDDLLDEDDDVTHTRGPVIGRGAADGLDGDDSTVLPAQVGNDTVVQEIGSPEEDEREQRNTISDSTRPAAAREEEDPLAEVNNYLAYEHFDQAEELVRRAIDQHPERPEYRVRLLDVLRQSRNVGGFAVAAVALREHVGEDSEEMRKATAWWEELAPGQPPFEAGDAAAQDDYTQTHVGMRDDDGIFDVTGAADVATSGVDFDLGFEMTGSDDTAEDDAERTGTGSGVDFDLDDGTGVEDPLAQGSSSDMDFMLDADEPPKDVPPKKEPQADVESSDIDFDLGFGDEADEASTPQPGQVSELDFDLDDEQPAAGNDTGGTQTAGTAGDTPAEDSLLDFDLDAPSDDTRPDEQPVSLDDEFDLGLDEESTEERTREQSTGTSPAATDSLDRGLEDQEPPPSAAGGDEPLRSGLAEEGEDVNDPSPSAGAPADFDLDLGDDEGVRPAAGRTATDGELDFDLGDAEGDSKIGDTGTGEDELDFDLGGGEDEGDTRTTGSTATGSDELDFDLGDTVDESEAIGAGNTASGDDALDFDLGSMEDEATEPQSQPAGTRTDAQDDTVLDLDFGSASERPPAQPVDEDELDFDLGGLDDDAPGSDTGLDLDLGTDDESRTGSASDTTREFPGDDDALGDEAFDTVRLDPDRLPRAGHDDDDELLSSLDDADDARTTRDGNLVESAVERHDSDLDFDLGTGDDADSEFDFDLDSGDAESGGLDLSLDDEDGGTDDRTLVLGRGAGGELDEVQTKLDLAQAYIDMGDAENARGILGEVMAEGSEEQIGEARTLLGKLD